MRCRVSVLPPPCSAGCDPVAVFAAAVSAPPIEFANAMARVLGKHIPGVRGACFALAAFPPPPDAIAPFPGRTNPC